MERTVSRRVALVVRSLMEDEPVVALQGSRAVGKTTLLRQVADDVGAEVIDLDDLATRDAAAADPALFVSGDPPVCIDTGERSYTYDDRIHVLPVDRLWS